MGTPDDDDDYDYDIASFHLAVPPGFQVPTAPPRGTSYTPPQEVCVCMCIKYVHLIDATVPLLENKKELASMSHYTCSATMVRGTNCLKLVILLRQVGLQQQDNICRMMPKLRPASRGTNYS